MVTRLFVTPLAKHLTPPHENDTERYLKSLEKAGIDLDATMKSQVDALMTAIESSEGMIEGILVGRPTKVTESFKDYPHFIIPSRVPVQSGRQITKPSKLDCHKSLNSAALAEEFAQNPTLRNPAYEGKSLCEDFFNFGIGTVDNTTMKTFDALASAGKKMPLLPTVIPPGIWGAEAPARGPHGERLTDIDFLIPSAHTTINDQMAGKFKVGSNDATLTVDPKKPDNSLLDDFTDYWPD
jgi:hypothetical protein